MKHSNDARTYSVLVIEDNIAMAILSQELLEERGHRVFLAYNGESGIETARRHQPQVVICDIRLQGALSGYDVAKVLRSDPSVHSYLISISAHSVEEYQDRALEAGFDFALSKPLDVEHLEQILTERDT